MADNGSSPTNVAAKRPRKRPSKAAVKAAMRTASDIVEDNPEVLDEVLDQVGATINARSNGGGLAEPEADELGDELIFVRNGWVRCVIAGQMFKLRRPFFGELRDLETSQEADQTQLTEISEDMRARANEDMARAREIEAEAKDLDDTSVRKAELDEEATMLAIRAMGRQQELMHRADDLRVAWWKQVFTVLTPPGNTPPTDVPSWVVDPQMQNRIIAHWRSVPLASGSG
jgi:hypothetical protein